MNASEDDFRMGKCPRCGHVDPNQTRADIGFDAEEDEAEPDEFQLELIGRCFKLKTCIVCGLGGAPRNHLRGGYFKRDMLEVVDELPRMGKPCFHCGVRIPRFLDLETEDYRRIYKLARVGQEDVAIAELMKVMGCPEAWARIWVMHPLGPRRPARVWTGPPCSSCGRPLRTRLARQCCECGLDWHDRDDPRPIA